MDGDDPGRDTLIPLAHAARIIGVSADHVRRLVSAGRLEEVARRTTSKASPSILVRQSDVERLARDGWPGRRPRKVRTAPAEAGPAQELGT